MACLFRAYKWLFYTANTIFSQIVLILSLFETSLNCKSLALLYSSSTRKLENV